MAVGIVLNLFAHQIKEEEKKKVTNNFKLFFNKKKPNIIEGDPAVVINAILKGMMCCLLMEISSIIFSAMLQLSSFFNFVESIAIVTLLLML